MVIFIIEDGWPLSEGEVVTMMEVRSFVEAADQVEQELPAGLRDG